MRFWSAAVVVAGLLAGVARADEAAETLERVRDRLAVSLPDVKREDIRPSKVPGLYEVQLGYLFGYVTADGEYLISGDMINLDSGEQITKAQRNAARLQTVEHLAAGAIEFSPPEELVQYTITVFTDVDCTYCRQLHREMKAINKLGIRVRYLFYPRAGPGSEAFRNAEAVWCSPDRAQALTRAKQGKQPKGIEACKNPVYEQYIAAAQMGIKGTPIMLLPNGELFAGYVAAETLLAQIRENTAPP